MVGLGRQGEAMKHFIRFTDFDPSDTKQHWRFCVEKEPGELTSVREERCRTRTPDGSVAEVFEQLMLSEQEVRWLHKTLGELVQAMDASP
jgi:hypothetical protein